MTTTGLIYGIAVTGLAVGVKLVAARWPRGWDEMENLDREAIEAFVEEARRATGEAIEKYDAWPFGDTPELADELAELVIHGPKRATAGLLAASEADGDAVPVEGGYSVVTDGAGKPVCVIRTSKVVVQRLGNIDAAFAWDEGEGDRSLAY